MSRRLGPDYFQRVSKSGEHAVDQWNQLAASEFVGVHLPEEYGGGSGLSELALSSKKRPGAAFLRSPNRCRRELT
jgi:alkylation response protein AidB-like acyl-CoA dehydrogenase